jgi:hypothetical protein
MMMQLITERSGNGTIARLYDCDCPLPGCERQWLICSVEGTHSMLGLCVATSTDHGVLLDAFKRMAENEENKHGVTCAEVIERGLALIGMRWDMLENAEVAGVQLASWARLPGWMDTLSRGQVWACRRAVFGDDLTRVPRALRALQEAYQPDAPVAADDLFARGRPSL